MLESALLVLSLCIDALVASFAYGTNKIKIPFISGIIITVISTLFLMLSITLGTLVKNFIPESLTSYICFGILFALGFSRLFEGLLKGFLNKKAKSTGNIELKLFDFKLILNVYADATLADLDHSKILSSKEALYLGIALALDSLIIGLGAALTTINLVQVICFSLIFNSLALIIGAHIGKEFTKKVDIDISWLSGLILIILALLKFI